MQHDQHPPNRGMRCPHLRRQTKIFAAILEHPVIEKVLKHLGLLAQAPTFTPTRNPHQQAACPTWLLTICKPEAQVPQREISYWLLWTKGRRPNRLDEHELGRCE